VIKAAQCPWKLKSDHDLAVSPRLYVWAEGGRPKASSPARLFAQGAGLKLSGIRGSGPGGRIVKRGVEEASHQSQIRKTTVRQLAESF
jgi:pyruvate/2-oxoglutarate dehydrogenase complex dihydrolipoamide acyltransferase (E2) component